MNSNPYIFISYNRNDIDFAETVESYLLNKGIIVWRDKNNIPQHTQNWRDDIWKALLEVDAVILLYSKFAKESSEVAREWMYALNLKKPILTVIWDDISVRDIHYALDTLNWIKREKKDEATLANLLKAVQKLPKYVFSLSDNEILGVFVKFISRYFEDIDWQITESAISDLPKLQVSELYDLPEGKHFVSFNGVNSDDFTGRISTLSHMSPVLAIIGKVDIENPDCFLSNEVYRVEEGDWEQYYFKLCDGCERGVLESDKEEIEYCPDCETECLACNSTVSSEHPDYEHENWCKECLHECLRCEEPTGGWESLCDYCQGVWDRDYRDD